MLPGAGSPLPVALLARLPVILAAGEAILLGVFLLLLLMAAGHILVALAAPRWAPPAAALAGGLLLPATTPLTGLLSALIAAAALTGLVAALVAHLAERPRYPVLRLLLWSLLLALAGSEWLPVAAAAVLLLIPTARGRQAARVEAPLVIILAGGAWGGFLWLIAQPLLGHPPAAAFGLDTFAVELPVALAAAGGLLAVLLLALFGRLPYGIAAVLALPCLVAVFDLALGTAPAPAGAAAIVVLPALALLAAAALAGRPTPAGIRP
jgi:hypothetical protein